MSGWAKNATETAPEAYNRGRAEAESLVRRLRDILRNAHGSSLSVNGCEACDVLAEADAYLSGANVRKSKSDPTI